MNDCESTYTLPSGATLWPLSNLRTFRLAIRDGQRAWTLASAIGCGFCTAEHITTILDEGGSPGFEVEEDQRLAQLLDCARLGDANEDA